MVYISSRGSPTYSNIQPDEFRENPATRKREQYALPTEEDYATTWDDVADVAGLGVNQLGRSIGTTFGMDDFAESERRDAEYYYNAMSPQMQRNLNATILPQEGAGNDIWDENISKAGALGSQFLASAPSMGAGIVAGGVASAAAMAIGAPAIAIAAAGIIADRGTSAALTYGDIATSIDDTIRQMDTKDILNSAPAFQSYLDRHKGNELAAKEEYAKDVRGLWPVIGGAISAALPSAGTTVARRFAGMAARKAHPILRAAGRELIGESFEEGFTGFAGQQAPASEGLGEVDWFDVTNQALAGGVLGGVTGGLAGAGAHFATPKEKRIRSEPVDGIDPAQRAALDAAAPAGATPPSANPPAVQPAPVPPAAAQPEVPPPPPPAQQAAQPLPAEPQPAQVSAPTEQEKPLAPKRLEEAVRFEAAGLPEPLSDEQIKSAVTALRGQVRPSDLKAGVIADAVKRVAQGLPAAVTQQVKTDTKILAGANNPATGAPVTGTVPEAIADLQAKVDAVARGEITGTIVPTDANVTIPGNVPLVEVGKGKIAVLAPGTSMEKGKVKALAAQGKLESKPVVPATKPVVVGRKSNLAPNTIEVPVEPIRAEPKQAAAPVQESAPVAAPPVKAVEPVAQAEPVQAAPPAPETAVAPLPPPTPPSVLKDAQAEAAAEADRAALITRAVASSKRTKAPTKPEEVKSDKDALARFIRRTERYMGKAATPHPGYANAAKLIEAYRAAAPKGRAANTEPNRIKLVSLMKEEPNWVAEIEKSGTAEEKRSLNTEAAPANVETEKQRAKREKKEADDQKRIDEATSAAKNKLRQAGIDPELAVAEMDASLPVNRRIEAIERRAKTITYIDKTYASKGGVKGFDRPSLEAMIEVYESARDKVDTNRRVNDTTGSGSSATDMAPKTPEQILEETEDETDIRDAVSAFLETGPSITPPVAQTVAPRAPISNLATLVTGYGSTEGKFAQETKKKRTVTIPPKRRLEAGTTLPTTMGEVEVVETVKVSDLLKTVKPGSGIARLFHELVKRRAMQVIPNMEVHIVDTDPKFGGQFDLGKNYIIMNLSVPQKQLAHTVYHELTHAMTANGIDAARMIDSEDAPARKALNAIEKLMLRASNEYLSMPESMSKELGLDKYFTKDTDEFVAELWSNKALQKWLATLPVSKAEATALGVYVPPGKLSVWGMLVELVRKLLRMPANSYSLLEASMLASDAFFKRNYSGATDMDMFFGRETGGYRPGKAQEASIVQTAHKTYPLILENVRDRLREAVDNPGAKLGVGKWARTLTYLSTTDQVGQMAMRTETTDEGRSAVRRLIDHIQRLTPYADKLREESRPLVGALFDAQRAMPGAFKVYAQKLYEVTAYGINLVDADSVSDADLMGANKHLVKSKAFDKQQAKSRMREFQDWFSTLPAADRALLIKASDYYRNTQNAIVDGSIRNTLLAIKPDITPAQIALVIEATKRNALTHLVYDPIFGKETVDAVNEIAAHRPGEGIYFPQMRHGKWFVSWREKLGDTMGGVEVSPGVIEWTGENAREQAEKFRDSTKHFTARFRMSEADDGAPIARLFVQTLGTSAFESESDAADFVQSLRSDPEIEWSSDYTLADKANYTPQGMTQMSVSKLISNVERETRTAANGSLIREAARQAAIQLLPGTRLSQRTLTRNNVKGADVDLARALAQYSEAASRALAKQEYMPSLYEALDLFEKSVKGDPQHPAYRIRRMFLNEFRNRIDANVVNFTEPPQWVHNLMALSFLDKLFSVAYSVVNSFQPFAVTYPYLAGKYGQIPTVSALRRAYASIGFTDAVISGGRNTARAIGQIRRTELLNTSDIHGSIRKKLAAQPDGADLMKVFDFATERGAIDPEAGFELAQSIAQAQGKLAEGISRVDRIARQMPQAVEQVNRAVTLVATYRLARKNGQSHETAMDEALVATRNTQGDYSAVNASPVFNTTPGRLALQFKKYAQMMMFLLGDMVYRATKGASVEERSQARKQLATLVGVQVAFAGVLGVPGLELIRYGSMITAGLGLTGGYEEWERYVRESIAEMTNPYVADLLTRGVIPRALNLDLSAKMGLDSILTFGEPRDYRQEGVVFFLTSQVVGAPGMLVFDQFRAAHDITQGVVNADSEQLVKGIEKIPLGAMVTNAIKATRLGVYGVSSGSTGKTVIEPSGAGTMIANALGFNTAEQSLAYERQGAFRAADTEMDEIDRRIRIFRNNYAETKTAGERIKLLKDMKTLNASLPEDRQISRTDLERFRKRYLRDLKEGRVVENYRVGKDIEGQRLRDIQSIYSR